MFSKIKKLKDELDKQKRLHPELMATIAQKLREDWTYNTNAIEGNTMTMQEAAFFLREGLTAKGRTIREHLEMSNHAEAIDYIQDAINYRDLTEGLIKEFHAMLFNGIKTHTGGVPVESGMYKTKDNYVLTVNGKFRSYVAAAQVPGEMEKLIDWYDNNKFKLHPIETAALFHHRIVSIHPFLDGNGRIGRLCMNYILIKNGYPPAIIKKDNRLEYYSALESADNNPEVFSQLVADEVNNSFKLILQVIGKIAKK